MAKRREKTLADYVVIAISPVLIMTLVGSLAFFLLELTYHGEYEIRVKWILFCYISASVLVARIAIEQGTEYASLFGFALAGVVAFAAVYLVDRFLVAWVLLAVSWWCTWKLTWDCTLIDDEEDASGEGLLQAAAAGLRSRAAGNRPVHAPGRWIVYFSLAALPLFGAGQLLIPSRDVAGRGYAFTLLAVYVASALGLLSTTSFLGLRRYLRQRKLKMPAAMAGTWLGMGTALAISLLGLAIFLPQPEGEYSLNALVDKVDAKLRDASRFAVVHGDRARGEGRRIGDQDPKEANKGDGRPPAKSGDHGHDKQRDADQESRNQNENPRTGGDGDGGQNQGDQEHKTAGQAGKTRGGKRTDSGQTASPSATGSTVTFVSHALRTVATSFKWLFYGVLVLVATVIAIRHWDRFGELVSQLWNELLALFGIRRREARKESAATVDAPARELRPFAAFEDPFFSGAARRMSSTQLVQYTFEALEAWGRERVVSRPPEQTPLEFARELGQRVPALSKDVTQTVELYARVTYAREGRLSGDAVEVLERLWRRMGMGAGVGAGAGAGVGAGAGAGE